jgi:hypothetical protein
MMKFQSSIPIAAALLLIVFGSSTAKAQVLIETGRILSPKTKDLGEILDKAAKGPKTISGVESASEPSASKGRASSVPRKPVDPLAPFSTDGEDPASVLDINADVLTRFSTSLSAEAAKREQGAKVTPKQSNAAGAEAGAFTARQYFVLKARVSPYCEAAAAGRKALEELTLPYLPTETMAIKPRCAELLPLMRGLAQ